MRSLRRAAARLPRWARDGRRVMFVVRVRDGWRLHGLALGRNSPDHRTPPAGAARRVRYVPFVQSSNCPFCTVLPGAVESAVEGAVGQHRAPHGPGVWWVMPQGGLHKGPVPPAGMPRVERAVPAVEGHIGRPIQAATWLPGLAWFEGVLTASACSGVVCWLAALAYVRALSWLRVAAAVGAGVLTLAVCAVVAALWLRAVAKRSSLSTVDSRIEDTVDSEGV